jgi:hypothetical protein
VISEVFGATVDFGSIGAWFFTARWLYRQWRENGPHEARVLCSVAPTWYAVLLSALAAWLWPVILLGLAITVRQPATEAERQRRLAQLKKETDAALMELDRVTGLQRRAQS